MKFKLWTDNKSFDDIDAEMAKDPEVAMINLVEDIKVLKEFHDQMFQTVKAVAHVGVDFGYGEFKLDESHIKLARITIEDIETE